MLKSARFSDCRTYRYALWRTWDEKKPYVLFIGLNPSVADETQDDATVTRCINYAKSWGYGGVCMANLFAFVATDPEEMLRAPDPVGPENDDWLSSLARDAGVVVAAWGNTGAYRGRSAEVRKSIAGLHCLSLNKSGEPAHPLYLKSELVPVLLEAGLEPA